MYNRLSIERNRLLLDSTVITICGSGLIIDQLVENGNGEMRSLDLMVFQNSLILRIFTRVIFDSPISIAYDSYYHIPDYTNWESGIENIGCLGTGCEAWDGITLVSKSNFAWNANDKSKELPYICMSKCPVNFIWYKGIPLPKYFTSILITISKS